MAPLAKARNTFARSQFSQHSIPCASGAKIFAGAMVAINAIGGAIPASNAAGPHVIGRADETVDNTGGSLGTKRVLVTEGIYKWNNAGTVVAAELGKVCDVSDDNTVAIRATGCKAGIVVEIESDGVWVKSTLEGTL